ncbi:MAG TPA: hypothetical protein VL947_06220, partial [Cytophagales bacterium]|nr:hypothetical protein [Cytophagales bacterium]
SRGFKYEARWHTPTPNAPHGSGANWRVTRTRPGSGATLPQNRQLGVTRNGNQTWISNKRWYDAQKALLAGGHFPSAIQSINVPTP